MHRLAHPGRRAVLAGLIGLAASAALAAPNPVVEVWKSASCGCCGGWIVHMRKAGFTVIAHDVDDLAPVKAANGVSDALASCHTAKVGGYVIEGHVPAADVARLLAERPAVAGLAAPGMPSAAPGMDGDPEPYDVLAFDRSGRTFVWARH